MKRILLLVLVTLSCYGQTPIKLSLARRILFFLCPCMGKMKMGSKNEILYQQIQRIPSGEFKNMITGEGLSPEITFEPTETSKVRTILSEEDLDELASNEEKINKNIKKMEEAKRKEIVQKLKEMENRLDKIKRREKC